MAQGYHLHLVASPVFQSYSAYTPYLDRLNARQILMTNSASRVIYTYLSIDGRYPAFDEPATFRALLTCYRSLYPGAAYLILGETACTRPHLNALSKPREVAFGRWITVPSRAIYAKVDVRTTAIGRLADIFYKPDSVHVLFRLTDGSVKGPYRFIYPIAPDGLFIKYFIGTQTDAAQLFAGTTSALRRIAAIKLTTNRGGVEYSTCLRIEFLRDAPPRDVNTARSLTPNSNSFAHVTAGGLQTRSRSAELMPGKLTIFPRVTGELPVLVPAKPTLGAVNAARTAAREIMTRGANTRAPTHGTRYDRGNSVVELLGFRHAANAESLSP